MSYESDLQRQEMGLAYKAITASFGPSAQLVAFINYDNAASENCGLESMDIMSQHEKILAEIDACDDQALSDEPSFDEIMQMEGADLFQLGDDIDQLSNVYDVLQVHGVNSGSFAVMQASGLLAGTSLNALSIESFGDSAPDSYESKMAMEGILDKIKEKAAAWGAKLMSVVKKIGNISFKEIGEKIKSSTNALVTKVSNTAHDVGKTIKAHPYKSALIAVGTIVAAAAAVTYIGQKLGENNANIEKIIDESMAMYHGDADTKAWLMTEIKNDPGRVQVFVNSSHYNAKGGGRFTDIPQVGTWQDLGWTKQNIVNLSNKMKPAFDQVAHAISTFVTGATKYVSNMNAGPALEAVQIPGVSKKTSHRVVTSLFWMVYRLVKTKIGGGFHHIAAMILRLMGH